MPMAELDPSLAELEGMDDDRENGNAVDFFTVGHVDMTLQEQNKHMTKETAAQ